MKTRLIYLLLIFIVSISFNYIQKKQFRVFFIQDNIKKEFQFDNSVFILQPKAFKIEVHLYNVEGVYVNISYDTLYYSTPRNERFHDWKYISGKAMAEEDFNLEKDIIVNTENVSYWFYDPNLKWYRFDKDIVVKENEIIGTMTVEQFYDVDKGSYSSVTEATKPIYFTFFTADKNQKGYMNNEIERKKIKVLFRN